jgi:hypothetical protein
LLAGNPVEVVPPELRGAIQPQVAISPNGNVFVAFGREGSIYCTASTNAGQSFLPPSKIATLSKLALGMRRGPRIFASDSNIIVSAISHADGNLYAWNSRDNGAHWLPGLMINSVTNAAREGLHGMAGDGNGNVYSVWLDLRNKGTQLWSSASHNGGITWENNVMVYQSPDGHICECCHPSVSVSASGTITVMWRNWLHGARDMYTAMSTDHGITFGPAKKVGQGTWNLNACPIDGGSVDGSFLTWRRENSIYYADETNAEHLLDPNGRQPVVAMVNKVPWFLWISHSHSLVFSKAPQLKAVSLSEEAAYPSIASNPDSASAIAVWEGTTDGVKTIFSQTLK